MGAVSVVGGNTPSENVAGDWNNVTGFVPMWGGMNGASTATEAVAQVHSAAGVWSQLSISITVSSTGSSAATFRLNGSNGNQAVASSTGATGWFTDTTHTDATVEGDLVCFEMAVTSDLFFPNYISQFESTGADAVGWFGQTVISSGISGGPAEAFNAFGGQWFNGQSATEANVQMKVRTAGTFSHFEAYENQASAWNFRLNGASGNQNLPATTGAQVDTTNTDATVSGDLYCAEANTTGQAWARMSVRLTSGNTAMDLGSACLGSTLNLSAQVFIPMLGNSCNTSGAATLGEQAASILLPFGAAFSHMRLFLVAADAGTSFDEAFRINSTPGNQAISTTPAAGGWFEDTSDTDTAAAGDSVSVGGTVIGPSSVTFGVQGMTMVPAGSSIVTATGTTAGAGAAAAFGSVLKTATGVAVGDATVLGLATGIMPSVGVANGVAGVTAVGNVLGVLEPLFDWEATVISQYQTSVTLLQLIENMETYIDPLTNLDAFYVDMWNIYSAVGYGLDVWGRIVGVTRTIRVPTPTKFLGFESAAPSVESYDFGILFDGSEALTQNYTLSDQAFRTLILAKALANICNGSIPAMNQILINLFNGKGYGNVYVTDGEDMTMTITFTNAPSAVDLAIISTSGVFPRPAGVNLTVVT